MKIEEYEKLISDIENAENSNEIFDLVKSFREQQQRVLTEPIEFIARVCELSGCTPDEIKTNKRKREIVRARQLVSVGLVNIFDLNLSESGRKINHDHTCYYGSIKAIRNDYQTDKSYRELFNEIFTNYPQILNIRDKREY